MPLQFPHLQVQQQQDRLRQRNNELALNISQNNQQKTRQIALANQINQAMQEFGVDGNADKAKTKLLTLGSIYGDIPAGQRLLQTNLDDLFGGGTKDVFTLDPGSGKLNKTATIDRHDQVFKGTDSLREERLQGKEQRQDTRDKVKTLFSIGGGVGEDEIDKISEERGIDFKVELEGGRGEPIVDKKTGKRKWRVVSQQEWNRKISEGKFSPTEVEHLSDIQSEHRAWTNVLDRLGSLGIDSKNVKSIETDNVMTPIGLLSLPARVNFIAQLSKDPQYTAIKRDIELAFQAFRKRVTGAQASDRELKMLRPLIAGFQDQPEVFFETVRNALENTEIAFNDKLDIYEAAGRDVNKFQHIIGEMIGNRQKVFGETPQVQQSTELPGNIQNILQQNPNFELIGVE